MSARPKSRYLEIVVSLDSRGDVLIHIPLTDGEEADVGAHYYEDVQESATRIDSSYLEAHPTARFKAAS